MKKSTITLLYAIAILSFFATCYSVIYLNRKVELYKESMSAKQVMLRQENGYLMWKYDDDSSWKNLYNLENLRGKNGQNGTNGKDGTNGTDGKDGRNGIDGIDGADGKDGKDGKNGRDGREVEFRVNGTMIQWKYTGESDAFWNDLFDLGSLNISSNGD